MGFLKVLGIGLFAGLIGGAGALDGPDLVEKFKSDGSGEPEPGMTIAEGPTKVEDKRVGFQMGEISPSDPVERIRVTITVGGDSDLAEPVDLFLGTGFPLRLYPLGTDSRSPAFAAFPQESSLVRGENRIAAGESASFEFSTGGARGQDILNTTPELLSGLTVGDLQSIGFASQGDGTWVLGGYRIEVNGRLFASNDSVDAGPAASLEGTFKELEEKLPEFQELAKTVDDLGAYVSTGLATPSDKALLDQQKAALEKISGPFRDLIGRTSGFQPWYVEEDEAFKPAPVEGSGVRSVKVTLVTGGGERPGSRNPVYLAAGGKKFLLTSSGDPLSDDPDPQVFSLSASDLSLSPVTTKDLGKAGIGMIGNEERFGAEPDRARLQRVVIEADGAEVFNSEKSTEDRRALSKIWLMPPAHFDRSGEVVRNEPGAHEAYRWESGTVLPEDPVASKDDNSEEPDPVEPDEGKTPAASSATRAIPVTGADLARNRPFARAARPPVVALSSRRINPLALANVLRNVAAGRRARALPRGLRAIAAPGPRGVTISQVQIAPVSVLEVGDRCTVNWTVTGVATGVTGYRVDLMPVLPEQRVRVVGPPLATFIAPAIVGGTGATSTPMPPIRPPAVPPTVPAGGSVNFNVVPGLAPVPLTRITSSRQLTHLYVQPRVVALGAGGRPINAAGTFGSVVSLFPAGTRAGAFGPFVLWRGPFNPVHPAGGLAPDPASAAAPAFSVFAPGPAPVDFTPASRGRIVSPPGGFFSSFQSLVGASDPGGGGTGAFALLADRSAHGLSFATNELTISSIGTLPTGASTNTGARTFGSRGNSVALVHEGFVPHPGPAGPGVIKGFRVVGHFGFLDGGPRRGGFAQVGMSVELSAGSTPGSAPLPIDLNMTTVDSSSGIPGAPAGAFFNYFNNNPIPMTQPTRPGAPLMMFDVPIRFDLLDAAVTSGALAGYPTPPPVPNESAGGVNEFASAPGALNPFGFSNIVGGPGPPAFTPADFAAYQAEVGAGGFMIVRVTVFIDTTRTGGRAVGLFGLRLVPDIS